MNKIPSMRFDLSTALVQGMVFMPCFRQEASSSRAFHKSGFIPPSSQRAPLAEPVIGILLDIPASL